MNSDETQKRWYHVFALDGLNNYLKTQLVSAKRNKSESMKIQKGKLKARFSNEVIEKKIQEDIEIVLKLYIWNLYYQNFCPIEDLNMDYKSFLIKPQATTAYLILIFLSINFNQENRENSPNKGPPRKKKLRK